MPLNADEIVGLDEFVQNKIDADDTLARQGDESNVIFQRVNADFFSVADNGFAGTTVNHIEAIGSNDPDDLQTKLNEVITAMNEGRRGGS